MKLILLLTALHARIFGGRIDNTVIGGDTPAAGAFSSLAIGGKTPVNAVAATGILTSDGTSPQDEAVATATLTSNESLVADGVTVTIGETVYTFKTALSDPAVPYEVLIGMNYSEQMHNLFLAITAGPGAGTCYGAGTEAHPDVTSEDVWNAAIIVTAKVPGDAGNLIAKATSSANLAWDGPGSYFTQGRDAETITIDAKTYTWKSALTPLEGEVLIGASAETALANLKNAINHEGVPGTDYSCAAAHPTVTATAVTATTLAVAAKIKGDAGNKIATTETETGAEEHVSWAATTLAGGIDGTPGVKNETCTDGAYLYVCTVANTVTDSNWRRLDLGSAYY